MTTSIKPKLKTYLWYSNRRLASKPKLSNSALWASSELIFHLQDLFQERSYFDSLVSFVSQYERYLFKRHCSGENNSVWVILRVELTVCIEEAFEWNSVSELTGFY